MRGPFHWHKYTHQLVVFAWLSFLPSLFANPHFNDVDSNRLKQAEIILEQVDELKLDFQSHVKNLRESLSEVEFSKRLEENDIHKKYPGFGKAELTTVDDETLIRMVHEESAIAFIHLEKSRVEKDSTHLQRIIAGQHLDSGMSRKDGKLGRDLVVVWWEHGKIIGKTYLAKPKLMTKQWRKEYRDLILRKPDRGDVALGGICGIAQYGLGKCVSALKFYMNPEDGYTDAPAVQSGIWGTVIGTFSRTYRRWTYTGTRMAQTAKSMSNSLLYNYVLWTFIKGDFRWMRVWDPEGILANVHLWVNAFGSNYAKQEIQQIPKLRHRNRMVTNGIKLPFGIKISRASAENQAIYLIPFFLRLVDITKLHVHVPFEEEIPFLLQDGIPIGRLALWASVFIAARTTLAYAKIHNLPELPRIQKHWDFLKRLPVWIPTQIGKKGWDFIHNPLAPVRACSEFVANQVASRRDAHKRHETAVTLEHAVQMTVEEAFPNLVKLPN